MQINLYLIPFVIIVGLLLSLLGGWQSRVLYIIICSTVLLFIAAMRSPEWMTNTYHIDTENYKYMFESTRDISWREFLHSLYSRYYLHSEESDIGYVALNMIIGRFTTEFWVFSLIADLLFFVPFSLLLFRFGTNMKHLIFAYVFYISLIQVYMIGGGRQMFAIGLDLFALLALIEKKHLWAILCFILGLTLHFSSFLFVIPLLLIWSGTKPSTLKVLHALTLLAIPFVLRFPNQIIIFMGISMGMERYVDYGMRAIQGGSWTFIILIELLSLFCFIAIKNRNIQSTPNLRTIYTMAPAFTFFSPLVISNGTMIRVSLYYYLFLSLLISYAIDSMFNKNNNTVAYVVAIGALSILALAGGGMTYYFFWQI